MGTQPRIETAERCGIYIVGAGGGKADKEAQPKLHAVSGSAESSNLKEVARPASTSPSADEIDDGNATEAKPVEDKKTQTAPASKKVGGRRGIRLKSLDNPSDDGLS